jgi:hypothetical protein
MLLIASVGSDVLLVVLLLVIILVLISKIEYKGPIDNPRLICPHCQERGCVREQRAKRKNGISGGKATGAVLTRGVSLLATGLSRKVDVTHMRCNNCGVEWDV